MLFIYDTTTDFTDVDDKRIKAIFHNAKKGYEGILDKDEFYKLFYSAMENGMEEVVLTNLMQSQYIRADLQKVSDLMQEKEFKKFKLETFEENQKFNELKEGKVSAKGFENKCTRGLGV